MMRWERWRRKTKPGVDRKRNEKKKKRRRRRRTEEEEEEEYLTGSEKRIVGCVSRVGRLGISGLGRKVSGSGQ